MQIQAGELIADAFQIGQLGVFTYIQIGELVVGAVQFSQLGVFTYIQTGELVVVTVQIGQLSILAHIKVGKIPAVAVQLFQIREIFNAGQVADVSCTVENDSGYFFPLGLAENAIFVIINSLLPQILTEVFIREVGRVNGDIARFIRLRGAGRRGGQGCNPFRQHRCAQRQGECTCHSGSADALNELVQIHKTPPLSRKGKTYPPP